MKAEAWLVIEFTKPRHDYMKPKPKITKVMQKRPTEGLAVKVILEMDDDQWEPTIHLKLNPLEVQGTIDVGEFKARVTADAEKFLRENM